MKNLAIIATLFLTSCSKHYYYPHYTYSNEPVSLGTVQRKLCRGMGQDQVAYALGAPNIVTKDKYNREAWIYDKLSSEISVTQSKSGLFLVLAGMESTTKKSSTTQKSLTVIIKFDERNLVDTISYHTSEF